MFGHEMECRLRLKEINDFKIRFVVIQYGRIYASAYNLQTYRIYCVYKCIFLTFIGEYPIRSKLTIEDKIIQQMNCLNFVQNCLLGCTAV
jgi:hypothetical protein